MTDAIAAATIPTTFDLVAVVESETDEDTELVARRVEGRFEGTDIRFSIVFPPPEAWEGRFFQYTYPLTNEQPTPRAILFGYEAGGYTVQAGNSGIALGHRHAAAAAEVSRILAAGFYGTAGPIRGYLYGPSGGSLQTVGALECTRGVWDGFVPTVLATPISLPGTFFSRAMARLVLEPKMYEIQDALQPGGHGDPYRGLDEVEAAVLHELHAYGVPWGGWLDAEYLLGTTAPDGLLGFGGSVRAMDPGYADDFWSQDGYLGTEASPLGDLVRSRLVESDLRIREVLRDADGRVAGARTAPLSEPSTGRHEPLAYDISLAGDGGMLLLPGTYDPATGTFELSDDAAQWCRDALGDATQVRVDNRWNLALRSYYRHQVPPLEDAYFGFAALRDDTGTPRYPQRPILIGPTMQVATTGGATYDGDYEGKAILVCNLLDVDALPWHADWYGRRMQAAQGAEAFNQKFRLYFNENADHIEGDPRAVHLVDYWGSVEETLVRLADWVENDVAPPRSTDYELDGTQAVVPAELRGGIQPRIRLELVGSSTIAVRESIRLRVEAIAADDRSELVELAWDVEGNGVYSSATPWNDTRLVEEFETRFETPGTRFITARVTSHLKDRAGTRGRVQNLSRVRVDVR